MRAIQCSRFGGPEVLTLAEVPDPVPADGEVAVQVTAAGINYADIHRVEGVYGSTSLPFVPGSEVVGHDGDGRRVLALTVAAAGGYAERAAVPAARAVPVPTGVDDGAALALLVQGLTAWHLLAGSARLRDGEAVVVNAAAGGVGSLLVQLARRFGAGRVIAAASTAAKRELALGLGADAAVDSAPDGYADRVRDANGGRPVDVVLDANGGAALPAALDALAPFGRLVSYGQASGEGRAPVDPEALAERNHAVVGFWVRPLLDLPGGYAEPLAELLDLAATGQLHPRVGAEYPLADAGRAYADLGGRRTTGKLVLRT
ncbi:MAG: zinc-binding alcohol dehydrogenase family protein [Mycobacteriales bacterium]